MDCADIIISDDAADGLIASAIYARILTDCAEYASIRLITVIDAGDSMDCADIKILDDATDGLITAAIYSMDCADTNVSDDVVDGLMMLMC